MLPRLLLPSLAAALACGLAAPAQSPAASASPVQVVAPAAPGEPIRFVFRAPGAVEWATVFFRAAGEEEFRSLPLVAGEGGLAAALPAGEVGGKALQYYVAYKEVAGVKYVPEGAPEALGSLELGTATPETKTGPVHKTPFRVEASLEKTFYRSNEVPDERTFFSNGQVALGYEMEAGEHKLSLQTRVAYQGQPSAGQNRWSVGEIRGLYGYREHRVQAGDMVVQESEFTVGGAGRRGVDYLFDDKRLYAHVFAVNTVQLPGFRGLMWPVKGTELFGGALGYSWFEGSLKSKLVLVTGKDDPASALNAGSASFLTPREGTTAALTTEAILLENRLSLTGEYARSSYDRNLNDAAAKVQDQAWRVGGAWTESKYSIRSSYRQVGRDFGTLGLPVMEGDRRGLEAGGSLTLAPTWSMNASLTSERNNPNANPLETRSRNDVRTLDARWTALEGFTLKGGLSQGSQEAASPMDASVPFANSDRRGAFGGFDWTLGAKGAMTFQVQLDRLEGTGATKTQGRGTTVTLGGSFTEPDRVRFAPTFSYAKNTDDLTGSETKVSSAFVNGDITLLPKALVLALNGGYNRTEAPGMAAISSSNLDAALQYFLTPHLERRFQRGQAVLALRYRMTRVQGMPEADRRASLTLNFSF